MAQQPTRDPQAAEDEHVRERTGDERSGTTSEEPFVRQDDALTRAERLPRRGDHELPPGNDTSI